LVTNLGRAEIDGVPFVGEEITPTSEISGLMMVLFLGGVESTAGLTATMFKLLAENPDQRALLRRDPSLIPAAVEETLRFATPLQLTARTTSREVTLHGVTIPAGGRVVLVTGAANRDERQFARPDVFDITRGHFGHVGFGQGIHGCLGAPLARLEARIALEEALPLLGDYQLAGPPTFYPTSPNMYVWKKLPISVPTRSYTDAPRTSIVEPSGHIEAVRHRTTSVTLVSHEFEADVRVEAKQQAADGVVALSLREVGDHPLPPWAAGAHVDLILDQAPTRQYSLCGDPTDQHLWRLGILRDPNGRGSSLYVHDHLQVGDTIRIRGPRNNFQLVPSPRYLFIAGGIGITPILPMIAAARAASADWRLVYGGRQRDSMGFLDELARYGDRVAVCPQDETGCSTWTPCSAPRKTTPWSTAAAPNRFSPPSSNAAQAGRAAPCTWSGSAPNPSPSPHGPRRSTSSWPAANSPSPCRPSAPSSAWSRKPGSVCCPPAPRAPAAPARPPCWKANPTTATRSLTTKRNRQATA
jgi:ferredoxin-NADP reductase